MVDVIHRTMTQYDLEEHVVVLKARELAYNKYVNAKLEYAELTEVYSHMHLRDKYVESIIEQTAHEIQVWNHIFTLIEKQIPPHNDDTTNHG